MILQARDEETEMSEQATVKCTSCQAETHPLDIFPGGICLECYKVTPEANREITAEELAVMWGGKRKK